MIKDGELLKLGKFHRLIFVTLLSIHVLLDFRSSQAIYSVPSHLPQRRCFISDEETKAIGKLNCLTEKSQDN